MTPLAMAERRARIEAAGALQGAWTLQAAAWRVRAELGLGLGAERFHDWLALYRVRAGLEVGRHLAGRWGGFVRGEATTAREGLADVVHDVTDSTTRLVTGQKPDSSILRPAPSDQGRTGLSDGPRNITATEHRIALGGRAYGV